MCCNIIATCWSPRLFTSGDRRACILCCAALLMRATYLTLSYPHHVRSRFMSSERAWLAREAVARLPSPQGFAATSGRAPTLFSTEEELEALADTLSKL